MLQQLTIRNYALIDSLEMNLHSGLSTLTGETGAGKSVIIGALSLLAGGRADSTRLRDKTKKAVIEAAFGAEDIAHLREIFDREGMEWDNNTLILRREIAPDGRSRIFVNDSPVSLKQLSAIGPSIIDIHSQHSNLMLADPQFRLHILDVMADNADLLQRYRELFHRYAALRSRLRKLRSEQEQNNAKLEYYQMQLERLHRLAPKRGEVQELEREQEMLENAETLCNNLSDAARCLSQSDISAVALIDNARNALVKAGTELIAPTTNEGEELLKRINSCYLEIKDIAETVSIYAAERTANPARLEKVQSRLALYYETIAALNAADGDALVSLNDELEQRIMASEDSEVLENLERETAAAAAGLRQCAAELTESRKLAAADFAQKIVETATPLGMKNLKFVADVTPCKLSVDGGDAVEYLCSFNKNAPLMPIQKVASGGEISRLMLALKDIVSAKLKIPVLVFDEVDTGVSGEIADKMGRMMADIASRVQVLAITHLPQVASRGSHHYLVSKADTADATLTAIRELNDSQRVEEIARMLSGAEINEAARANAKSMLNYYPD